MTCSLRTRVLAVGVLAASTGVAHAASTAPVTHQYTGPAGVVAGHVVSAQVDGNPTGRGVLGVQVVAKAGKLRIQVVDDSGREVAARVTAFVDGGPGFQYVVCRATDFVTPMRSGSGKVYVTPLAGPCGVGGSETVVSAPTTGQITIRVL